jgi:hypothetical protein
MALQCDATRVISYMLEDERSEYVYDHVPKRRFTAEGSEPGSGTCGNYHGAQHAGDVNDDFATISWWNAGKVAALCERLDAIPDGPDTTLLDNTVVLYASCMHGGNHQLNELPVALIGSGGRTLRTDQHIVFPDTPGDRPMRDLYVTLLDHAFGLNVGSFGVNTKDVPNDVIAELIASRRGLDSGGAQPISDSRLREQKAGAGALVGCRDPPGGRRGRTRARKGPFEPDLRAGEDRRFSLTRRISGTCKEGGTPALPKVYVAYTMGLRLRPSRAQPRKTRGS